MWEEKSIEELLFRVGSVGSVGSNASTKFKPR